MPESARTTAIVAPEWAPASNRSAALTTAPDEKPAKISAAVSSCAAGFPDSLNWSAR